MNVADRPKPTLSDSGPDTSPVTVTRLSSPTVRDADPVKPSMSGLAVTTLMTPADAFLPNSVLCGPRSTSMRSRFGKSFRADAERERYTPSMKTPTDGSMPALLAPLPKPRIRKLVLPEVCSWVTRRLGTRNCRSLTSCMRDSSRSADETTETAIGISCKVDSRLLDVTTISSMNADSCS